jgi:hypothetical protein
LHAFQARKFGRTLVPLHLLEALSMNSKPSDSRPGSSLWQEEEPRYLGDRTQPDWEALIAAGTVPALVLGAERRLSGPRQLADAVAVASRPGADLKA